MAYLSSAAAVAIGQKRARDPATEDEELRELGFICPITQEMFHDPVVAADGHTYEVHSLIYMYTSCSKTCMRLIHDVSEQQS